MKLSDLIELPEPKEKIKAGDSQANWLIETKKWYINEGYNQCLQDLKDLEIPKERILDIIAIDIEKLIRLIIERGNICHERGHTIMNIRQLSETISDNFKDIVVFTEGK